MIAPVAGSGSWPTWIARVSKSIRRSLALDALEAEDAREPRRGALELRVDVAAHAAARG